MTEDLRFGEWTIPGHELIEQFTTPGGPGGQHANRNATAVRLRFDVEGSSLPPQIKTKLESRLGIAVEVTASEERSQSRNRETARRRLVEKLESAMGEPKQRRPTKPTRASRKKRVDDKRARSKVKRDRRRPTIDD